MSVMPRGVIGIDHLLTRFARCPLALPVGKLAVRNGQRAVVTVFVE